MLGAFDPFQEIAAICKKHKVWMHVDGCWGAASLLSPEHRHLMKGCELSDSLAWNPHKLMGLPLQCSAFITTHKGQQRRSDVRLVAHCLIFLILLTLFCYHSHGQCLISGVCTSLYGCMFATVSLAHASHQKLSDQHECLLQACCSKAMRPMPAISFSQTS